MILQQNKISVKQDCLLIEGRPPVKGIQTRFLLYWPWPWPDDLDIRRCTCNPA